MQYYVTEKIISWALLLTALVIIAGCAITGKSKDQSSIQYRNAHNICIRFGYVRDSNSYNRCMDRVLRSRKNTLSPEQD